jgi:regulator of telomere elongation helicase 1
MAALRQLPLRSVLLTSGTLSPLESFAHELQLGFKYTLENPHVIQSNQVRQGVPCCKPTPTVFTSNNGNYFREWKLNYFRNYFEK